VGECYPISQILAGAGQAEVVQGRNGQKFNLRRSLVRTNFQLKSTYDIAVVCFYVYLSELFAKCNITRTIFMT